MNILVAVILKLKLLNISLSFQRHAVDEVQSHCECPAFKLTILEIFYCISAPIKNPVI